jgi:hypothetical protein
MQICKFNYKTKQVCANIFPEGELSEAFTSFASKVPYVRGPRNSTGQAVPEALAGDKVVAGDGSTEDYLRLIKEQIPTTKSATRPQLLSQYRPEYPIVHRTVLYVHKV